MKVEFPFNVTIEYDENQATLYNEKEEVERWNF